MKDRDLLTKHGHLLTTKEHAVIELYIRGLSQRTIALALDISRSSVQSRLETAIRKLRIATKGTA
jgi:DNA-binding NarL/FixJ family response regulator